MKAVVLLSGGLDSATVLYYAKKKGLKIFCLTFDYGQRHRREIDCAKRLARQVSCKLELLKISLPWKGSSLLDKDISLPKGMLQQPKTPSTYVPARNIIFLSYAVSYGETIGAKKVFIGANQIDYSGYPDCRTSFIKAFEYAIKTGTKQGVEGGSIAIETPLINKKKSEIIMLAKRLNVPLERTWSCYRGARKPCLECSSCLIRARGFEEAGVKDPLIDG